MQQQWKNGRLQSARTKSHGEVRGAWLPDCGESEKVAQKHSLRLSGDKTYLITGGLGGLGFR